MFQFLLSILFVFCILVSRSRAAVQCYFPDGTVTDSGTQPCNATIGGHSACCDPRDACSESGMCFGASGWIYRSGCTDITWQDPACPQLCEKDPSTNLKFSTYTAVLPCPDGDAGTYALNYCCNLASGSSCCKWKFKLPLTGLAFKPGEDLLLAQLANASAVIASLQSAPSSTTATSLATTPSATDAASITASSSSSATANATAEVAASGGTNLGLAIGAGVGIPLGILALGILGFLLWREVRKNKADKGMHAEIYENSSGSFLPPAPIVEAPSQWTASPGHDVVAPVYVHTEQVHELKS